MRVTVEKMVEDARVRMFVIPESARTLTCSFVRARTPAANGVRSRGLS